ncbi:MAG: hypothetical protein IPH07_32280 [Deltaproteobacteria bacterium]|nr:hypothetical protein [Deltaproteobacteria bacterium]MBP7285204.1 hypothetical protein [Nannocystaceae bacterium]
MSMLPRARMFLLGVALGATHCDRADDDDAPLTCTDEDATRLFDERIAPLLSSERQSTCNECHLSGVNLGLYGQGDPCATMACMVESGIVDLEQPRESVVLSWILRAEPANALITQRVIDAEHDAVLQWIEYNARCGAEVCPSIDDPCGGTQVLAGECEVPNSSQASGARPYEDPGDCSDRTLEEGFAALVYSWRGRCYPCHFDSHDGDPEDAPRWIKDGACDLGSLATMREVVGSGLLDAATPSRSLLLTKPLAEQAGGVVHGGHDKMPSTADPAYQDYAKWIEMWARCQ